MDSLDPKKIEQALRDKVLTPEDLEVIAQFQEWQKDNKIFFYEPYHKQTLFHQSMAPYRMFIAGNRIGKTVSGACEAIFYALGRHPHRKIDVPNEGWVISMDYNVQKEAAQRIILEYLPKSEVRKISYIKSEVIDTIYLNNGSKITFKSADSGVEKFYGAAKRWIWFDEEPQKDIWNECLARIGAGMDLNVWMTMTPIKEDNGKKIGLSWTYRELYLKKDGERIFCVTATLDDNPYLTDEQKIEQKKKFHGVEYDIRIKGEFKLISGNHVFDIDAISHQNRNERAPLKQGHLKREKGKVVFEEAERGYLKIWHEPGAEKISIGVDIGLGVGGDPSCAVGYGNNTLKQYFELCGQLPPDEMGEYLLMLGEYYRNPWIGIEANSFGISCIDTVKKRYSKLYYRYKVDRRSDTKTKQIGWWTDSKSKPIMISDFSRALRDKSLTIHSSDTLNELMTYVVDKSGSANAEMGCNDDRVIASMIALQVRKRLGNSPDSTSLSEFVPANKTTGY